MHAYLRVSMHIFTLICIFIMHMYIISLSCVWSMNLFETLNEQRKQRIVCGCEYQSTTGTSFDRVVFWCWPAALSQPPPSTLSPVCASRVAAAVTAGYDGCASFRVLFSRIDADHPERHLAPMGDVTQAPTDTQHEPPAHCFLPLNYNYIYIYFIYILHICIYACIRLYIYFIYIYTLPTKHVYVYLHYSHLFIIHYFIIYILASLQLLQI